MELIVDLHIHSRFARATSSKLTLPEIYKWAKIKGINVIGTGDFTHPKWFEELENGLEESDGGLYSLKKDLAKEVDKFLPNSVKDNIVRFIPTVEISNMYTRNGKGRRLHNLVITPSLKVAKNINTELTKRGANLKADGRPIIGMDSYDLLKITINSDPDSLFIPAHIWTPWFAMFGSKSGFDTITDCFGDLSPHIYAIETGLSSDPFMNWRLSQLDKITIISGSDAHSLPKLAREANIINCDLSYKEIIGAIKTNDKRFIGTFEFFPEEGMYHLDGHRKCNIKLLPSETNKLNGICPVCHTPLVVGVMHRVDDLADRPEDFIPKKHKEVHSIVPIIEMIAEIKNIKSIGAKSVVEEYEKIYSTLGSDFSIFRNRTIKEIKDAGFEMLSHAIDKVRRKDIVIDPGYDGVYGIVKVFKAGELESKEDSQLGLGL